MEKRMPVRMFLFIVPVFLVITVASAQAPTPSDKFTGGFPNGRFWSRLTQPEKIIWLFGYSDGIKTAAAFVSGAEPTNKLLQQAILDFQPTDKLTTTETVQGIDHFFQDTPESARRDLSSNLFSSVIGWDAVENVSNSAQFGKRR